ncbi:hypothetical protein [Arthrobacter sp. ES3-54]|jgi:hypothetical protein|uniref:hypothetical protein n=1 Tax=Arthrobacter sp. ES3-54 TaxID=1502991 RepID=UPI002405F4E3|nr:hypothetical protein [Arthrobacter sp. ES3-54]MDF9751990.1 uncharacterized membrane protein YhaH (DUF805 family) [Arthrobacter sp. ES3-54]
MASDGTKETKETDARLRIADALVVMALAVTSLVMIWRPETDVGLGILQSLLAAMVLLGGAVVLGGRTRAGRLVLTRRRWKYFTLIGVVLGVIILIASASASFPGRTGATPALALFPALVGLFLTQLYEPEKTAQAKASDLSNRDAKVWKRSALVSAAVGIVLGCIAGLAAAAGNIDSLALLLPIALLFLVFAAAIWMMLRTRNRQLEANP